MKEKTIKELIDAAPDDVQVPWDVWRFLPVPGKCVSFAGKLVSFGEDFGSLEDMREAIEWFVTQLGGKVKWE